MFLQILLAQDLLFDWLELVVLQGSLYLVEFELGDPLLLLFLFQLFP